MELCNFKQESCSPFTGVQAMIIDRMINGWNVLNSRIGLPFASDGLSNRVISSPRVSSFVLWDIVFLVDNNGTTATIGEQQWETGN